MKREDGLLIPGWWPVLVLFGIIIVAFIVQNRSIPDLWQEVFYPVSLRMVLWWFLGSAISAIAIWRIWDLTREYEKSRKIWGRWIEATGLGFLVAVFTLNLSFWPAIFMTIYSMALIIFGALFEFD